MIGLIIYLVGGVFAYRRQRKTWIRQHGDEASWLRLWVCFIVGAMSWFGFVLAMALDDSIKPPKWL